MTALQLVSYVMVGLSGLAVVAVREPVHQVIALGVMGLALTILFVVVDAPEVALSQLAVGAVLIPFLFFAAIARATRGAPP